MNDSTAPPVRIRLYYDFASTLCYVAHRVLTSVETEVAELGVEIEWCPIDLTEAVPWDRGDSFADEVRTSVRNTALTLGVDVEMPDPWLDSRPASQIALKTGSLASEAQWRAAVFRSIFEHGEHLLSDDLLDLARELIGEDNFAQAFGDVEASGPFPIVEQNTEDAMALGVNGVPTLLLDDWLLGGVFDGESMLSILAQLAEQYRDLGHSAVN